MNVEVILISTYHFVAGTDLCLYVNTTWNGCWEKWWRDYRESRWLTLTNYIALQL